MSKQELIEKLKHLDEVLLLELLDISSEELVDAFIERVYDRIEYIYKEVEEV